MAAVQLIPQNSTKYDLTPWLFICYCPEDTVTMYPHAMNRKVSLCCSLVSQETEVQYRHANSANQQTYCCIGKWFHIAGVSSGGKSSTFFCPAFGCGGKTLDNFEHDVTSRIRATYPPATMQVTPPQTMDASNCIDCCCARNTITLGQMEFKIERNVFCGLDKLTQTVPYHRLHYAKPGNSFCVNWLQLGGFSFLGPCTGHLSESVACCRDTAGIQQALEVRMNATHAAPAQQLMQGQQVVQVQPILM